MKKVLAFALAFMMCFLVLGTYGFEDVCTDPCCHHDHAVHADGGNTDGIYMKDVTSTYSSSTKKLTVRLTIGLQSGASKVKGGTLKFSVNSSALSKPTVAAGSNLFGELLGTTNPRVTIGVTDTTLTDTVEIKVESDTTPLLSGGTIILEFEVDESRLTIPALRSVKILGFGSVTSLEDDAIPFDPNACEYPIYICEHRQTTKRMNPDTTCSTPGVEETVCLLCDGVLSRRDVMPDNKHEYDLTKPLKWLVEPTCTTAGQGQFKCTRCGTHYEYLTVPAKGHQLGERYLKNGVYYQKCSVCEMEVYAVNQCTHDAKNYTMTGVKTASTCTTKGVGIYVCPVCGAAEERELPLADHTVTNWTVTTPATCTADGVKTGTCSVCHATVTAVAAKTGHTYGDWVLTTPATCTTDGVETHTCSACHATETRAVAKSGHNYSAWMTTTAPTCTAAGTQARVCEYCGDRQEQILPMVAHTYGEWAVSKPATCSAVGQEIRHCVNCSASETRTAEINPDAHTYGEWTVEVLRTCLADGLQKRVCKDCGKEETKVDACLGHQFGPTMMEGNVAAKMCSVCGYREEVETLKKGKMKTLTNSLASLVVSGATAEQELLFTFEDMPTDMATYYKQYLTFESAYVYSITSGSEALTMSEEMTLKLMLDDSLEDSAVSLTMLKDNSVYPVECSRKGQTLTIDGEAITGADAIFVIKDETEKSNLVLPLVIVGITVVGAGVALYFVLSNSKKKESSF